MLDWRPSSSFGPYTSQAMPYAHDPTVRNTNAQSSGHRVDAYSIPASRVVGMTMCRECNGDYPMTYPGRSDDGIAVDDDCGIADTRAACSRWSSPPSSFPPLRASPSSLTFPSMPCIPPGRMVSLYSPHRSFHGSHRRSVRPRMAMAARGTGSLRQCQCIIRMIEVGFCRGDGGPIAPRHPPRHHRRLPMLPVPAMYDTRPSLTEVVL